MTARSRSSSAGLCRVDESRLGLVEVVVLVVLQGDRGRLHLRLEEDDEDGDKHHLKMQLKISARIATDP